MEQLQELWNTYYPVLLTVGGTMVAMGTALFGVYMTIKPILDKIKELKSNLDSKTNDDTILKNIQMETMKTDLLAKLQNPTIDAELKAQYQSQLDLLNKYATFGSDAITKAEETVNKYSG